MATLVPVSDASQATSGLPPRGELDRYHLADENRLVSGLAERAIYTADERIKIDQLARRLVQGSRDSGSQQAGIDAFMKEYGFSNEEGIILLCLAEALLRIPDAETADALIADKIGGGTWERHMGHSDSLMVNASTWGLMLSGRVIKLTEPDEGFNVANLLNRMVKSAGEPVIRNALRSAMRVLGDQFVLGRTIEEALRRAAPLEAKGYRYSYDMLGEAARTEADAERYFDRYMSALRAVGKAAGKLNSQYKDAIFARPSLSVKLSAIHPRFEPGKDKQLEAELLPRLKQLAFEARALNIGLTIDAEEQSRLEITLDMFGALALHPELAGWDGVGIAVQAYSKRAIPTLRWLRLLAQKSARRIPVRLVKGAYWDSEIKWAQEQGLPDYPVFTRKLHTDVSYLACVRLLNSDPDIFYPQFATHNAHTVASVAIAGNNKVFEFQRLHGMGENLYNQILGDESIHQSCRIYAPVGGHKDLLAYLVRRLLENGANTSFVNRLSNDALAIEDIVADPVQLIEQERENVGKLSRPAIPRPPELFGRARRNSLGLALSERSVRNEILAAMGEALREGFAAAPLVNGSSQKAGEEGIFALCPHDRRQRIGKVVTADNAACDTAVASATNAAESWNRLGGEARAELLEKVANLYEHNRARLMAVIVREAGKTLDNALGDVREAVDFLRYYAREARRLFAGPTRLPGPTGEVNELRLHGQGPFVCISPWNFPLAIFTGQIAGALAAGNPVLAKPAEQTPLTAYAAIKLFHEAGVPADALHLLPGNGMVGARLINDERVRGVAFTGSNATASHIQKALAARQTGIVPFIAETGGINAMIVDSSALPEQVTRDVVHSAFDSAGQRCSATRVVFIQDDVADSMIDMIAGATDLLAIGDPIDYGTDVGPVIDEAAKDRLEAHKARMLKNAKQIIDCQLPHECAPGTYVSPAIFEIEAMSDLDGEVFGPILHVVRYSQSHLDAVCDAINKAGYGLTLGVHTRIERTARQIAERVKVGNIYINRNQIGAVVGVQPFGGRGLSGTGPKAGGPNYLMRFATERVVTTDITATGGNIQLLNLAEE
ncbi:MAG: bifunctional proline dehydrogenase/L-glutamate gamma-semialdehyde dehydrogenase PutA [Pseudomonadota bacterium]